MSSLFEWSLKLISYLGEFFLVVNVWNQSTVKHILDIFKEAFMDNIIVREDEDCLQLLFASECSHFVHHLNEFSEVPKVESLGDFKLVDIHLRHET